MNVNICTRSAMLSLKNQQTSCQLHCLNLWILKALMFLWCLLQTKAVFTLNLSFGLFLTGISYRLKVSNIYLGPHDGSQV